MDGPFAALLDELLTSGGIDRVLRSVHFPIRRLAPYDDFRQDVLLRAVQQCHSFRGDTPAKLGAWIKSIASQIMIDCIRQSQRKAPGPLPQQVPDHRPVPADLDVATQYAKWLNRVLGELEEQEREILHRRYHLGQRWSEIGLAMNIGPNTLAQKHLRLIQRLKRFHPPEDVS